MSALELTPLKNAFLLPYSSIRANPDQPRTFYDPIAMAELRSSIEEHGIQQPLTVRYAPSAYDGTPYLLVSGERRYRAAEGVLKELPCIVQEADEATASELSLIENIQREDLTSLEEARKVQQIMLDYELSIERVARRLGKSTGWVNNRLALIKTGPDIKAVAAVTPKSMSSLLLVDKVKQPEKRAELLERVKSEEPLSEIKASVEAHLSAVEAQKKADDLVSTAPDTQTQARLASRSRGESSSMSRGLQVTGPDRKLAKTEVEKAIGNMAAWTPLLSDAEFEKLVKPFARRLMRGDLSR